MKLLFEHVQIAPDRSWRGLHRQLPAIPFEWHYHPEYELTLTINSAGRRYVGDHIGDYRHEDLVLLGPNLPHTWHSANADAPVQMAVFPNGSHPASGVEVAPPAFDSDNESNNDNKAIGTVPHQAFVFWFSSDWIDTICATMPELAPLVPVLHMARRGAVFDSETARQIATLTPRFDSGPPTGQLVLLLEVLGILTRAQTVMPLASARFDAGAPPRKEATRLGRVLDLLHASYARPLAATQLAGEMGMSERTLRRFFKSHMGSTIQDYVMGLRLGRAAALLLSSDMPVYRVAEETGFENLSHFNRQFVRHKSMTPTAFRKSRFAGK
ncbi:AraC family transcriptional regulator [Thalassospira mesophila]|uniref:AraC family transcriptional regulator n=1 Tax=Thalassospira mesophila TaxID=1293891 RepID=UPI000A1EA506|nr:AraC family transcriptional regulator [Thalassospira mesophila]